jgi:hypothetical protein
MQKWQEQGQDRLQAMPESLRSRVILFRKKAEELNGYSCGCSNGNCPKTTWLWAALEVTKCWTKGMDETQIRTWMVLILTSDNMMNWEWEREFHREEVIQDRKRIFQEILTLF